MIPISLIHELARMQGETYQCATPVIMMMNKFRTILQQQQQQQEAIVI